MSFYYDNTSRSDHFISPIIILTFGKYLVIVDNYLNNKQVQHLIN